MAIKKSIFFREFNKNNFHLTLAAYDDKLCLSDWTDSVKFDSGIRKLSRLLHAKIYPENPNDPQPVLDLAEKQLTEYLEGKRKSFSVPLIIVGSDFHQKAMDHLLTIPYGEHSTYKDLAEKLTDGKRMSQCIGSCIGSNLLSIFIPCHRVISKQFINGGYRGGLPIKQALLDLEKANL